MQPQPKRTVVFAKPRATIQLPDDWELWDSRLVAPKREAQARVGWGGIAFEVRPVRVFDWRTDKPMVLKGNLISWLRRHPHLRVGKPVRVRLGGASATQIDGRVLKPDLGAFRRDYCGVTNSRSPCVPVSADPDMEGYVSIELAEKEIIEFDSPRRNLLVHVSSWRVGRTVGQSTALLAESAQILSTLRFG